MTSSNEQTSGFDPALAEEGNDIDPRQYLRVLLRYKWSILAITVVVTAAVTFWSLRQSEVYEAKCTLEFDPHPPRPLGQEVEDVSGPFSNYWSNQQFFATQREILESRSIAKEVVRDHGLHQDPSFFGVPEKKRDEWEGESIKSAASKLQSKLSVSGVPDTRLVKLKVTDGNPERAARLANAIAETYIKKTKEDRLGATVSALEWLGKRLDQLREKLRDSELALHQFKKKHNVLSVSVEDKQNLVSKNIEGFSSELQTIRTRRIKLQAHVERLREANAKDPMEVNVEALQQNATATKTKAATLQEESTIESLRQEIMNKERKHQTLSVPYGPNHPKMEKLDKSITTLRKQLRSEIDNVIRAAEAELREIKRIERGLREALQNAHDRGFELNRREIKYRRLKRRRENNEELYSMLLERSTETELTRMLQTTFVRKVDKALVPGSPVSPNHRNHIAGGLGAGLVLAVAFAFLLGQLDRRIKRVEDVEALGLPMLGILPQIAEENGVSNTRLRRQRKHRPDEVPLKAGGRDTIVQTHPMSAAAECCRTIRTNLTFMSASQPSSSFVVTSALPREGKTTVATNLAITVAHSGKHVLLIDSDLRRPRVHKVFGVDGRRGLTNLLVGEGTLNRTAAETDVPGLDVLPCGPIPPNPSELLHSERFGHMLHDAENKYDRIIFDSPPLGAVTDAAVIAPQVGGAILVIKVQQTTRDGLRTGLRQLRDVGANIVGGILNEIDLTSSDYRYDGYYYYYYHYGQDAEGTNGDGRPSSEERQLHP